MKKEFVNALMEKYTFFYRDPEKKVYKKVSHAGYFGSG